ncbi:MAG TPA: NADPH:quinone oxidoreductase family protein [Solirubrobacteraceae bacterium]|nr:NADPH:quinone oxidoreductase family protein [Solirubrobacteraceae bacterium]
MQAVEIFQLSGPPSALRVSELPEPDRERPFIAGAGVKIDVRAAGVAFPELLQTRGLYQIKPELPFIPGSEIAGIVREAPAESAFAPGAPVMAFCGLGGFAEVAVAPEHLVFALPERFDFAQGASFILNYHTAYFSLVTRGHLQAGERVLIHGAAGGIGTAALQVARGLGATTIALVSSEAKREVAQQLGADHVLISDGPWKDEVRELTDGGVDVVFDSVGGDRFIDSLRSLRAEGRLLVVGFAGGSIPEVKVNRLLLTNTSILGAAWGGYAVAKPEVCRAIGAALAPMIESGVLMPLVGERYPLERAADALISIEQRRATGKVVLEVGA